MCTRVSNVAKTRVQHSEAFHLATMLADHFVVVTILIHFRTLMHSMHQNICNQSKPRNI